MHIHKQTNKNKNNFRQSLLNIFKQFISPTVCIHCNTPTNSGALFCYDCSCLISTPTCIHKCNKCRDPYCLHKKQTIIRTIENSGPGADIVRLFEHKQTWAFDHISSLMALGLVMFDCAHKPITFNTSWSLVNHTKTLSQQIADKINAPLISSLDSVLVVPILDKHKKHEHAHILCLTSN